MAAKVREEAFLAGWIFNRFPFVYGSQSVNAFLSLPALLDGLRICIVTGHLHSLFEEQRGNDAGHSKDNYTDVDEHED